MVLGKLGPGQLGPGLMGPGLLGPTDGPRTVGPNCPGPDLPRTVTIALNSAQCIAHMSNTNKGNTHVGAHQRHHHCNFHCH